MLERKLLNIYASEHVEKEPTIVVVYTTNKRARNKKWYIGSYSMWVRNDKIDDIDTLNIANMFLKECFIYKGKDKDILEKDLFKTYQYLFGNRLWLPYKVTKQHFETERALNSIKPYRNYTIFTEDTMQDIVNKKIIDYTKKAQRVQNN